MTERLARIGDVINYEVELQIGGTMVKTSMVIDLTETTLHLQNGEQLQRRPYFDYRTSEGVWVR